MSLIGRSNLFNNPSEEKLVDVYTYLNTDLFDEIMNKGRVYPVIGITKSAAWDGAYKALERRLGHASFFAWDRNCILKNKQESNENCDEFSHVYVHFQMPTSAVLKTDYGNWCDLIIVYEDSDMDPTPSELEDSLCAMGMKDTNRSLDQLWEDIYCVDEDYPVQLLVEYFDKKYMKEYNYTNNPVLTYSMVMDLE